MIDFESQREFAPADIALFTKWMGWATRPEHLNNDPGLMEREQWFWVSPEALEALEESLWDQGHADEVPVLVLDDLPSLDGMILLSNPMRISSATSQPRQMRQRRKRRLTDREEDTPTGLMNLVAIRWTARGDHLVVQPVYGSSLLAERQRHDPDVRTEGLVYAPPPEATLRPGAWQQPVNEISQGVRHAPRSCLDGSPLLVLFPGARIWHWGRVARVTTQEREPHALAALDAAVAAARTKIPPTVSDTPAGDDSLRSTLDEMARQCGPRGATAAGFISAMDEAASRGDGALDAFDTDFNSALVDHLPIMGEIPDISACMRPVPAELIDLPTEDDMKRLVAREPLTCHREDASLVRLLHCLWGFASLPLPPNAPRRITRDIPKHRRSTNPDDPTGVRVLVLREAPEPGTVSSNGPGRKRPRRHLVHGHWRRQWHPALQIHRRRWIAPHLRAGHHGDTPTTGPRTVRSVQPPNNDNTSTSVRKRTARRPQYQQP